MSTPVFVVTSCDSCGTATGAYSTREKAEEAKGGWFCCAIVECELDGEMVRPDD